MRESGAHYEVVRVLYRPGLPIGIGTTVGALLLDSHGKAVAFARSPEPVRTGDQEDNLIVAQTLRDMESAAGLGALQKAYERCMSEWSTSLALADPEELGTSDLEEAIGLLQSMVGKGS